MSVGRGHRLARDATSGHLLKLGLKGHWPSGASSWPGKKETSKVLT